MDPAMHDHLRAHILRTYDYLDTSPPNNQYSPTMDPAQHDRLRARTLRTYNYTDTSPPHTPTIDPPQTLSTATPQAILTPVSELETDYHSTSSTRTRLSSTPDPSPASPATAARIAAQLAQRLRLFYSDDEERFKVPGHVFAESCPVCDELALGEKDPGVAVHYPQGWVLVSCKRHRDTLLACSNEPKIYVGGVEEERGRAVLRYLDRNSDQNSTEKDTASSSTDPPPSKRKPGAARPGLKRDQDPCPICTDPPHPPPLPRLHPLLLHPLPNSLANPLHRPTPRTLAPRNPQLGTKLSSPSGSLKVSVYVSDVQEVVSAYEIE